MSPFSAPLPFSVGPRESVASPLFTREEFPFPTEEEARAAMLPTKVFSLSCMIVQVIIDTFFCGIFTAQVYTYIRFQSRDRWWTRALVAATAVLTYTMTAYIIWFIQHFFIQYFGLYQTFFETAYLSWFPLLDSLISGLTQGFFTYRAWRLNHRNYLLLAVLVLLISTAFAAALWVKIEFAMYHSLLAAGKVRAPMTLWLASIMSADMIITAAILVGLLRTRTGWTRTDRIPPLILAIIFLIQYSLAPASLLGSTFQSIQSKLYSIGLLYTLNARVLYTAADITMGNTGGDEELRGVHANTVDMTSDEKAVWEYELRAYPGESEHGRGGRGGHGEVELDVVQRREDVPEGDAASAEKPPSSDKPPSYTGPAAEGGDSGVEEVPVLLK